VSPFDFKLAFQNVDRIRVWLLKQSCRTLNLEQLLFLENFELPYKFGSNLGFKASGNSVISVNSVFGRHLTDGELPTSSRRARGHVRLRAGVEKAAAWLPLASKPRYKVFTVVAFLRSSPLFFPTTPPLLRQGCAIAIAHTSRSKACHSSACSLRTQPTSP